MRNINRYGRALTALALAAGAAWAIGELTITNPPEGAQFKAGQVIRITWRNMTTNPIDVWLKWDGRREKIGEYGSETDGMVMWRVTDTQEGEYRLVVEEVGGLGSSATVNLSVVGGAPVLPQVYATPNPFDLSAGAAQLTFAGAPGGSAATIYDMLGREVIRVSGDPLQWDGRNERGDMVAGGTYMFVVELPTGEKHTGKIAVVK